MNLFKGYGYVEFKIRVDVEKVFVYMDGVCDFICMKVYEVFFDFYYMVLFKM